MRPEARLAGEENSARSLSVSVNRHVVPQLLENRTGIPLSAKHFIPAPCCRRFKRFTRISPQRRLECFWGLGQRVSSVRDLRRGRQDRRTEGRQRYQAGRQASIRPSSDLITIRYPHTTTPEPTYHLLPPTRAFMAALLFPSPATPRHDSDDSLCVHPMIHHRRSIPSRPLRAVVTRRRTVLSANRARPTATVNRSPGAQA